MPRRLGDSTIWRTRYRQNNAGWIVSRTGQTKSSTQGSDGLESYDPEVQYEYDQQGHQTRWRSENASENDQGRDLRWTYWPNGQLKRRTATKTVTDSSGTREQERRRYDYHYNENRSLVSVRNFDAIGERSGAQERTTTFGRDAAERETRIDETWDDGRDVLLAYDQHTGDLIERRTEGTFPPEGGELTGTNVKRTSFAFDSLGRETRMTVDPARGEDRVTQTRWFGSGSMRERTKPNGTVDRWRWNALGEKTRHERIRKGQAEDSDPQGYIYDANGNRTRDERGEHEFNARDQLSRWTRPSDRGREDRRGWATAYETDGSGQMLRKVERDEGGATKLDTVLTYDGERLRKTTTTDSTQAAPVTTRQNYRYDDAGNVQRIYTQVESNLPVQEPEPGETALSPDECSSADVTPSTNTTRYCYDEFNRQVFSSGSGVTDPAYVSYDGLDRRDRKVRQDTTGSDAETRDYSYIGTSELLASETKSTGGATPSSRRSSYDYDSNGDRQGQQADGTGDSTSYRPYAKDANGSVVGLEQGDGQIAENERYAYDPYGELDRQPSASLPGAPVEDDPEAGLSEDAKENPFRFQGFYYDSGVKTYDMHARHYRPDGGRFLSRDQYAAAAGDIALQADPLTQNRYAFAGANPVTNVEFDGHRTDQAATPAGRKPTRSEQARGKEINTRTRGATDNAGHQPYLQQPDVRRALGKAPLVFATAFRPSVRGLSSNPFQKARTLGLAALGGLGFKAQLQPQCLNSACPLVDFSDSDSGKLAKNALEAASLIPLFRGARLSFETCKRACRAIVDRLTQRSAAKAPQALRPLASNPLSPQKQAGHVPGTPQHLQRLKVGKPTSTFFRGDQAEELTRRAWANGVPVPGRAGVRDFEFGFPVGRGPGGGLQTRVRVHVDTQGRIHGHPAGRELIP